MKFHHSGIVKTNARNNILIVERDAIYITESDGRYIQTIGHRSIKQLYDFIASFRDRYIITINSKAIDNQTTENCRLLLFDPNNARTRKQEDNGVADNQEDDELIEDGEEDGFGHPKLRDEGIRLVPADHERRYGRPPTKNFFGENRGFKCSGCYR
ncbi:unnamed protein product, partial [Rotaria sordida]